MAAGNGDGLLIVTPICAAFCSNAVADVCGEFVGGWNGESGVELGLGLGFSLYCEKLLPENNCEERSKGGGPGPAAIPERQANHGGILLVSGL